jgi:hypothetical protein
MPPRSDRLPIALRLAPLWGLALVLAAAPARAAERGPGGDAIASEDALPRLPPAREVIERAFENFYQCDLHADLDFVVRRGGVTVLQYETELLRKYVRGMANELFYFEGDGDRRGIRVLRIEQRDRADDAFVYLPELQRIRRVVMAQHADKLMGMEVTLEDLEIQRVDKFEIVGRSYSALDGEPVHVVTLKRLLESAYDRVDFFIAARDYAMLEVRYYRRGMLEPYKTTRMSRAWMEYYPHRVLPKRIDFLDRDAGTETTLLFRRREVDPELSASRFSTLSLEKSLHLSELGKWTRERGE